jgi:hypothetical protein
METTDRDVDDMGAVCRIVVTGGRRPEALVLAAWPNGRVLWSEDAIRGGPPYRERLARPQEIDQALADVLEMAGRRPFEEVHTGPDAGYTTITVWQGGEPALHLGSWHELFEADGGLIVTAGGVEPLFGRDRLEVLAAQPADYRSFRALWEAVKARLTRLAESAIGTPS